MKKTAKQILSVVIALAIVVTALFGTVSHIAKASAVNLLKNSGFEGRIRAAAIGVTGAAVFSS